MHFVSVFLFKSYVTAEFIQKTGVETDLLKELISNEVEGLRYTNVLSSMRAFVDSEPDVIAVRLVHPGTGSTILEVEDKGKKGELEFPLCKGELLDGVCLLKVSRKIGLSSEAYLKFEALYSTKRINEIFSRFKLTIGLLELVIVFIVCLVYPFSSSYLRRRIEKISSALRNWKEGGIEKLKEQMDDDELREVEEKIVEVYEELIREKRIDDLLLRISTDLLKISGGESTLFGLVKKTEEVLNRQLGINYLRIKPSDSVDEVPGRTIVTFLNNPDLCLVIDGEFPYQNKVLAIVTNILDSLFQRVKEREAKEELFFGTITALANAIDALSPWTKGHSQRVAEIAVKIGEEMKMTEEDLHKLKVAGILHDIGKIGVSLSIIDKPGKLTPQEYEVIKRHPEIGYEILKPIKQLKEIVPAVLYHHERCNGSGYPKGLKCDEIPLMAKIIAVADVIEAMTAERPYKRAFSLEEVFDYLRKEKGTLFDPEVVEAAERAYSEIAEIVKRDT